MTVILSCLIVILLVFNTFTKVEIDQTKWRYSADGWTRTDNEDGNRVEEYDHNGWDGAWIPANKGTK